MTRTYSHVITAIAKHYLSQIADKTTSPIDYQAAMVQLGHNLGNAILSIISPNGQHIFLATTAEDADYLAQGILTQLETHQKTVGFACFWNQRSTPFGVNGLTIAPILKKYQEPVDQVEVLVIVKSIISSGCTVRTNLENLIQHMQPSQIVIAAPVIYANAEVALSQEFDPDISNKFEFVYFARDDDRTPAGEVVPGIGGMIEERLGLNGQLAHHVPNVVKTRRQQILQQTVASTSA